MENDGKIAGGDIMVSVDDLSTYWTNLSQADPPAFQWKILLATYAKARLFVDLHQTIFESFAQIPKSKYNLVHFNEDDLCHYANCLNEEPFGQVISVWRLFLKQKSRPRAWFEMFSTFLSHVHYSSSISTKSRKDLVACIQNTKDKLNKKLNAGNIDIDWFELSYSLGEFLALHDRYLIQETNGAILGKKWWSMDHMGLDSVDWKQFFQTQDINSNQLKIKFLFQKIKFLSGSSITASCIEGQMPIVKQIINLLKLNPDLMTDQVMQTLIPLIDDEKMSKVMEMFGNRLMSNTSESSRNLMRNRQSFQTAVITWIISKTADNVEDESAVKNILTTLSQDAKLWHQYESTLAKESNPCWTMISSASSLFEELPPNDHLLTAQETAQALVKVLNDSVAFDSMPPLNQTRVLLVISSLLVSCPDLTDLLVPCYIEILDGFRSVWFFSILKPNILMDKLTDALPQSALEEPMFRKFCQLLVTKIFSELRRTQSFDSLFHKNSSRMSLYFKILSLRQLKSWADQKSLNDEDVKSRRKILKSSVKLVVKEFKNKLAEANGTRSSDWLFMDTVAALLEAHPKSVLKKNEIKSLITGAVEVHLEESKRLDTSSTLVLQVLCDKKNLLLKHGLIPNDFVQRIMSKIIGTQIMKRKKSKKRKADDGPEDESSPKKVRTDEDVYNEGFVKKIIKISGQEELPNILQMIIDKIQSSHSSLIKNNLKTAIIFFANLNQEPSSLPVAEFLQTLFQKVEDKSTEMEVVSTIVQLLSYVIKSKCNRHDIDMAIETIIVSTQHLATARNEADHVYNLIDSILSFLHEMLIDLHKLSRFNISCFIIISRLLKFILRASSVRNFGEYTLNQVEKLESTVQKMVRTLNLWCSIKGCEASTPPQIVAIYINEVHKLQINQRIKEMLAPSLCRLVRKSSESDIGSQHLEMIHCRLNQAGKEFLRTLIKDYEQNKFKGNV